MRAIFVLNTTLHRFLNRNTKKRGILLVIAIVGAYSMLPSGMAMIKGTSTHQEWEHIGVQIMQPIFADAYNITSAIDSWFEGFDPLVTNPADITGRPMNYPRIWLAMGRTGIRQEDTAVVAGVFISVFALTLLWMIRRCTVQEGIVYSFALCSPAVMLAVERGNNDVVIAALLMIAAFLPADAKYGTLSTGIRYIFLLFASVLKLFPVAVIAAFANFKNKRRLLMVGGCLVMFALYIALNIADIQQIRKVVPAAISTSFGSMVLPDYVLKKAAKLGIFVPQVIERAVSLVACIFLPLVVLRRNSFGILDDEANDTTVEGRLWISGAAVFCTVFLLGNNYDYRLIFLLLTVPQLLAWIRQGKSKSAGMLLALVGILLWLTYDISYQYVILKDMANILSEVVAWTLYALFCAQLLNSVQPLQGICNRIRTV